MLEKDLKVAAPLAGREDSYSFHYNLGLIEKQVRILNELVDACTVTLPDGAFVLLPKSRVKEIVENLDLRAGVMRRWLQEKVI